MTALDPRVAAAKCDASVAGLRLTEVTFYCPAAGCLVDDPAHIGKIRGAFGEALVDSGCQTAASADACSWTQPCTCHALFRISGMLRPGKAMPSPFVIQTDRRGSDLVIRLILFGAAGDRAGEAADALVRALCKGLSGYRRLTLEPAERHVRPATGVADPGIEACATLRFLTPVLIRNAEAGAHVEPGAMLRSLIHRTDAMIRWGGRQLDIDFPALLDATKSVEGAWTALDVKRWTRGAVRQGRQVPMEGALGRLHLRGQLAPFSPFLAAGAFVHCGARVQWGLGRYIIESAV